MLLKGKFIIIIINFESLDVLSRSNLNNLIAQNLNDIIHGIILVGPYCLELRPSEIRDLPSRILLKNTTKLTDSDIVDIGFQIKIAEIFKIPTIDLLQHLFELAQLHFLEEEYQICLSIINEIKNKIDKEENTISSEFSALFFEYLLEFSKVQSFFSNDELESIMVIALEIAPINKIFNVVELFRNERLQIANKNICKLLSPDIIFEEESSNQLVILAAEAYVEERISEANNDAYDISLSILGNLMEMKTQLYSTIETSSIDVNLVQLAHLAISNDTLLALSSLYALSNVLFFNFIVIVGTRC